jgi:hypothetical protein
MNLLYTNEYIFFNLVFHKSLKFLSKQTSHTNQVFIISIYILNYCIINSYKNLNITTFLINLNESFIKNNRFKKDSNVPVNEIFDVNSMDPYFLFSFITPNLLLLVIKFLFYCSFAIFVNENHSSSKKNKDFKLFLLELKQFVISYKNKVEFQINNQKYLKIYYTYRLTFKNKNSNNTQYYMGYRGCSTSPQLDIYYSSSKIVNLHINC